MTKRRHYDDRLLLAYASHELDTISGIIAAIADGEKARR